MAASWRIPVLVFTMMIGAFHAVARETPVTCTNSASGAQWQIKIDYGRGTVDSNIARISATEISWRDNGGSHYTLNRTSGELTMVSPSSTGGYFLHHRCKLPD